MKKSIFLIAAITIGTFLCSCSNNKTEGIEETKQETEKVIETTERPAESDQDAVKMLNKFDSKVASIMKTLREMKSSMEEKGTKITPTAEKNISDMFTEAKEISTQLESELGKLSEKDFSLYERTQERLRDKETDFETLKQNK